MATRFSATAAAIGLVGGVLAASPVGAATTAARPVPSGPAAGSGSISSSVADPDTAPRPLDTGSTGIRVAASAPVAMPPAAPQHSAAAPSAAKHATPKNRHPRLPFHTTGRKARSLPDTGVPMSAALGTVTALTALLAGVGTVRAARRRTDREA